VKLSLSIHYPEGYPDVLPELELEAVEGDVNEKEIEGLLDELKTSVSNSFLGTVIAHQMIREKKILEWQ
jgi:hypothetical protein